MADDGMARTSVSWCGFGGQRSGGKGEEKGVDDKMDAVAGRKRAGPSSERGRQGDGSRKVRDKMTGVRGGVVRMDTLLGS
jgi:hypothetical protein